MKTEIEFVNHASVIIRGKKYLYYPTHGTREMRLTKVGIY